MMVRKARRVTPVGASAGGSDDIGPNLGFCPDLRVEVRVDDAAGAAAIVDHHRLAEMLREFLAEDTPDCLIRATGLTLHGHANPSDCHLEPTEIYRDKGRQIPGVCGHTGRDTL
jgi:hypothetical protein